MATNVDEIVIEITINEIEEIIRGLKLFKTIIIDHEALLKTWSNLPSHEFGSQIIYHESISELYTELNKAVNILDDLIDNLQILVDELENEGCDNKNQPIYFAPTKINARIDELNEYLDERPGKDVYKIKNNTGDMNSYLAQAHQHFEHSTALSKGQDFWDEGDFHHNVDILNNLNERLKMYKFDERIQTLYNVYRIEKKTYHMIIEAFNIANRPILNDLFDIMYHFADYKFTNVDVNIVSKDSIPEDKVIETEDVKNKIDGDVTKVKEDVGDKALDSDEINKILADHNLDAILSAIEQAIQETLEDIANAYNNGDVDGVRDGVRRYQQLLAMYEVMRTLKLADAVFVDYGYDQEYQILTIIYYDANGELQTMTIDLTEEIEIDTSDLGSDILGFVPVLGGLMGGTSIITELLDWDNIEMVNEKLLEYVGSEHDKPDMSTAIALDIARDNGVFDHYGDYEMPEELADFLGSQPIEGSTKTAEEWLKSCYSEAKYVMYGDPSDNTTLDSIAD